MAKDLLSTATIGGRSVPSTDTFDVFDPATSQPFASAPLCSKDQLDEAILVAEKAQVSWANSEIARRNALVNCAERMREASEQLATLITREQGKPIEEARSEVAYSITQFEQYAAMQIPSTVLSRDNRARTLLLQRPFGVVGLITPWNFPVGTASVKIAPALLAGNTVILKPSPVAPLAALFLGNILKQVLPPGVFNTLSGGPQLGIAMTEHPRIRKLSLTGSTETGKRLLASAAKEVKSVTLELGGNDPAIVLPDAPVDTVVSRVLDAAWRNTGQVCSAIKRVYVHDSIFDSFLKSLLSQVNQYTIGPGIVPGHRLGPLTLPNQPERLEYLVQLVNDSGGKIHRLDTTLPSSGHFFAPCIATEITHEHSLVQSEQFGPILPILRYSSIEQAIECANDSPFGLSASVWTANPNIGYEIGAQLECGRVGVNGHKRADSPAPFGGFKHSGIGRELGVWGLLEMTQSQVVNFFG